MKRTNGLVRLAMVVVGALLLVACAPAYDEQADKLLVGVQQQTDDGLLKLETYAQQVDTATNIGSGDPAARKALADTRAKLAYAANIDWYASILAGLTGLEARLTANPDFSTARLSESLGLLRKNIELFQARHAQDNTVSASAASTARQILDQQFKALTVYMVTVKTGSAAKK